VKEPNDYASEHLRDQLIHDPRVHEQDLTVRVEETRVTVGGRVSTPERQQAVTQATQELMPGKEITNETVVVAQDEPDPDGDERMA
jgi:osmotically-inducible protein OsmY